MDIETRGILFPLRLGPDRGLAVDEVEGTVRSMLLQILLTSPGERVNRPTFGVGVEDAVFEPNGPLLENRIRLALDENTHRYLGDNVRIVEITVSQNDSELKIHLSFQIIGTISGPRDVEVSVPLELNP